MKPFTYSLESRDIWSLCLAGKDWLSTLRPTPRGIAIDGHHGKVIDFNHSVQVGSPLEIGNKPFAWESDVGSYGLAGPVTEQFAMVSILYCLTRGHKPYEDKWFGKDHRIHIGKMLRNREFPQLETYQ